MFWKIYLSTEYRILQIRSITGGGGKQIYAIALIIENVRILNTPLSHPQLMIFGKNELYKNKNL